MGIVGRKIEQTRVWVDPTAPPPPNLNYNEVFPITVFDAIRQDMNDEDSVKLTQVIADIYEKLSSKQTIFPAKPANYLMTYAGTQGSVGSIMISTDIPWDPLKQSHDRIPTEKAVGMLMQKLGLVNEDGSIADPNSKKVRWSDIIGRPLIYEGLGINNDGFITQKAITDEFNKVREELAEHAENSVGTVEAAIKRLDDHSSNMNNPHNVTIGQIGAVSREEFDFHTQTQSNPHGITAEMIGLGKVNNTSDVDKPISIATQEALDAINRQISELDDSFNSLDYINDIEYTQSSGKLTVKYCNGTSKDVLIPINGLVDEIRYDTETKDLVVFELSGDEKRVSLMDLYIRYTGSIGTHITIEIGDTSDNPDDDSLIDINRKELEDYFNNGIIPDGEFDGTQYNLAEITKEETDNLWNNGILPEESGNIIGITLEEITARETNQMWTDGTLPDDSTTGPSGGTGDIETPGIKIIRAYINPYSITDYEMDDDSVVTRVIKNLSVTEQKIADGAITEKKIANGAITSDKIPNHSLINTLIADRAINGRTLFSSPINNRILAVLEHGTDPVWTQINGEMIKGSAIRSDHLAKESVTDTKIADGAVTNSKIENGSISTEKLQDYSVKRAKIGDNAVDGTKIDENVSLKGTPRIGKTPKADANNNEVADTRWVNDRIRTNVNNNENLADRSVDGRVLFSSSVRYRVLVTLRAGSDPVWDQIYHDMMANDSVGTNNLIDGSVIGSKIGNASILNRHLTRDAIRNINIEEGAVTSSKLWRSNGSNMVLGAIDDNSHPIYTKVNRSMIENYAISTMQIEDKSVTPSKIQPSEEEYRVLGVGFRNTQPMWMEIYNKMIKDRAVDGRTLFSSPDNDTVLAVSVSGDDPFYQKINGRMINHREIRREHIGEKEIWSEHLREKIIESQHIMDWTIKQNNIAPRAITGTELFTSPIPERVLGVTTSPYANPEWLQITRGMIEDKAVNGDKLFRSNTPYRVLGVTQAGVPAEYLMITADFIVDSSITPGKLVDNFTFFGTPSITVHPKDDSDNHQVASTHWVRETVKNIVNNIDPEWFRIQADMIPNGIIDGTKLFKSHYDGPRVLGVTKKGEDPEYILIEEDLIVNEAVTEDKIARSITLHGSPSVEVRPSPLSSDSKGGGSLIPDCQWVLDRIAERSSDSGTTDPGNVPTIGDIPNGSIGTEKLIDRSVTGDKLFTSGESNRILAVLAANTNPVYTRIINDMINDRQVDGRTLFTSDKSHVLLGVSEAGSDPEYIKVDHDMMAEKSVGTSQLIDESVTNEKYANKSITREKIADAPIIDTLLLKDNSVTEQKIVDCGVTTRKINDNAVTSEKLDHDIILKGSPTVNVVPIETKSLRNITISSRIPTNEDGEDGDIWITYI